MINFVIRNILAIMQIEENLLKLKQNIVSSVKLVVVSKTQSPKTIRMVYDTGHRVFGENKVQDFVAKHPKLPADIEWHFIGHLQRNKVRQIVPITALIHSIDSLRLLQEVNKEAAKVDRVIDCLLQFHISTEETKFGLDWKEASEILESQSYDEMQHIRICGVMGMATFTNKTALITKEFSNLRSIFQKLQNTFFNNDPGFREISMGMTGDYQLAIDQGSTIVRIGTAIFGPRNNV